MNRNWILCELVLHLFVSSIHSAPTQDPLIFNPYTREIYDLENITSSTHDGWFAVACPAETPEQFKFDRKYSLDGKALFVRHLLKKDDPELQRIKCENPYRIALVCHKTHKYGNLLEFGYEIYYTKEQVEPNFILDGYDFSYGIAAEMDSKMERFIEYMTTNLLDYVKLAQKFVWISKIAFSYNSSKWSVMWVSHTMSLSVDQLKVICETTFELGPYSYNLPEERTLLHLYSPKNQEKIFNHVNLPTSVDGICSSQHKCLEEYNLAKPYRFQTHISQPVKCSKLTSIPIWYKTKELLDYSQNFIIALAQTIDGNRMKVLTGVHDVLTLSKKGRKNSKKVPIYLGRKKLPVPKIIYKIVTFEIPDCDPKKPACRLDVVIVIHNGPEILPHERLCDDKCTEWGWDSIQFLSTTDKKKKSQFIYCCELDEKLHKRFAYSKRPITNEVFNLRSFQHYNVKDGSPNSTTNIQTKVEIKMNELFIPNKLHSLLGLLP